MKNFEKCAYTYRHRRAFLYVLNKIVPAGDFHDALLKRATIHDMDKMVNLQKMSEKEAKIFHRKYAPHHNITNKSSDVDLMESIIDFECAGYTKVDKPYNAYDFIRAQCCEGKINTDVYLRYMNLLAKYHMDYSYSVRDIDPEGARYFDTIIPSEEDIQTEINIYFKTYHLIF